MLTMSKTMQHTVLAVSEEVFRDKSGQGRDTIMYRLYMQDERGHVGYIYSSTKHAPGDVVTLGLIERDGQMRLKLVRP